MKVLAFLFLVILCSSLYAQRKLKKVVVIEEYTKSKLKMPKKRALLEIEFNEIGEKEFNMFTHCSQADLDVFSNEERSQLSTSIQAVMRSVMDSTQYSYEFDPLGRMTKAVPKEALKYDLDGLADQDHSSETLRQWRFEYDSSGYIVRSRSGFNIFRGGTVDHYYNKDGLVIKRVHWHPRGFINSTEEISYRNGLPVLRVMYWRGGVVMRKLHYTYTFY